MTRVAAYRARVLRHAGAAAGDDASVDLDERISSAIKLLELAAVTKAEDGELVVNSLLLLEKDVRAKAKADPG